MTPTQFNKMDVLAPVICCSERAVRMADLCNHLFVSRGDMGNNYKLGSSKQGS